MQPFHFKNIKIILLAFAESKRKSFSRRFKKQAIESGFFSEIIVYNEKTIPNDFFENFNKFKGSRGYGYWSWKPFIIHDQLKKINENDILLYMDIGCHINKRGLEKFLAYVEKLFCSNYFFLGFNSNHPQISYTKRDLLIEFGYDGNLKEFQKNQICASLFFLKKTNEALKFTEEWLSIFKEKWHLIDDSKSESIEYPGFIKNRHDQSVLSLLCSKYDQSLIYPEYRVWRSDSRELILEKEPLLILRDKKFSIPHRIRKKISKILSKINLTK